MRRLCRPHVARGLIEVHRPRVVVHVAHEQHADGAFLLRGQRLAPRRREFGRHHPFKRTLRVAFARLVVEHERDLPLQIPAVVVVLPLRRRDAEPGEHDVAGRAAAGAEALRVELLAVFEPPGDAARAAHLERVALAQSRRHERVVLEVRAVGARRLQSGPFEARADVVGRGQVLDGVGEAAAHGVAGQEKQVGTQLLLPDRFVLRRSLLRRERGRGQGDQKSGGDTNGHDGLRNDAAPRCYFGAAW